MAFGNLWTQTDIVNLINGDNPEQAYLNITTFEEDRTSWIKNFYLMATTMGGVTLNNDNV